MVDITFHDHRSVLTTIGLDPYDKTTVGDSLGRLTKTLRQALDRSHVVISCYDLKDEIRLRILKVVGLGESRIEPLAGPAITVVGVAGSMDDREESRGYRFGGDLASIRIRAGSLALDLLRRSLAPLC
jgi:hypothetical protein